MFESRWLIYAVLSALSAAFVGIFAKTGMKEVDSTLATIVRSIVMTLLLLGVGVQQNLFPRITTIRGASFAAIICSGAAGALSWLFYFKAIQLASVSQVAPIDKLSMPLAILLAVLLLGERPTALNWLGILLVAGGAYLAAMPRPH